MDKKDPRQNYILVNDLPGQNNEVASWTHQYIRDETSQTIKDLAQKSILPSELLVSFIPNLKDHMKQWYRQKGILDSQLNLHSRFFVLPKEQKSENEGHEITGTARARSNTITLFKREAGFFPNEKNFEYAEAINNFEMLRTAAHEAYHAVSPIKLHVQGDKELRMSIDRDGIEYFSEKLHKEGNALEEGLAVLFEFEAVKSVAATSYPEGLQAYYGQLRLIIDAEPDLQRKMTDEQIPIECLKLEVREKKPDVSFTYINSVKLVKYLSEIVPHFRELVEQLRIKDESLPLARIVEKTFGRPTDEERRKKEDPFSLIVLAREENAAEVMVLLKKRIEEKNRTQ